MLPLLLAALTPAQDAEWLLVGNSYTARNDLAGILRELLEQEVPAWSSVEVTAITTPGHTLAGHLADADGSEGDTALRQALVTAPSPWHAVVLQEQSQIPGFPQTDPTWTESRDALVALDDMVEATGADTALFLTWGRRDGDPDNPALYPDFSTMQDALTAGYLAYMEAIATVDRPVVVAPVGEAFRVIHDQVQDAGLDPATAGTPFWELYAADGSHPSVAGTALAAAVFLGATTGRRATPLPSLTAIGLDADRQQALFAAAAAVTVDDPVGDFPWPWVVPWSAWPAGAPIHGDVLRPRVLVDTEITAGTIAVDDGVLSVGGQAIVNADAIELSERAGFSWSRGYLRVDRFTGDLDIPRDGFLEIDDRTEVAGTVVGDGTIAYTGPIAPGEEVEVLTTAGLNLLALQVEVPDGATWEARDDALWVLGPAPAGADGSGKGCGCVSGEAGVGWLAAVGRLVARRR